MPQHLSHSRPPAHLHEEHRQLSLQAIGQLDERVVGLVVQELDADDVAVVGEEVEELGGVHLLWRGEKGEGREGWKLRDARATMQMMLALSCE